ncbi:MAG TPA: hypothetical protein VF941_22900, partial [Clostridia bacterium]
QGCRNYLQTLLLYLNVSAAPDSGLRTWKYVDINSFSRLLAGGHSHCRWTMVLLFAGTTLPLLFRTWWKADCKRADVRGLIWSSAIAWTLVLNVYLTIYDTISIVLSVLITTDVLYGKAKENKTDLNSTYKYLLLLLYLIPWVTQPVARLTNVQLFTLVLAAFGFYLNWLICSGLSKADGLNKLDTKSTPSANIIADAFFLDKDTV